MALPGSEESWLDFLASADPQDRSFARHLDVNLHYWSVAVHHIVMSVEGQATGDSADDYDAYLGGRSVVNRALARRNARPAVARWVESTLDEPFVAATEPDTTQLLLRAHVLIPQEDPEKHWWLGRIPKRGVIRESLERSAQGYERARRRT